MIRRTVRVQLVAFLLITVLGITYAGFKYVGIGQRFFNKPFTVTVVSAASGGIFPNAEVTMRGVQVGKVTSLRFRPDGVAINLAINHSYAGRIPQDTRAVVADLSAVGEQYVDLQPATDVGPWLADGDTIHNAAVPIDDATLLLDLDKLVNSVNRRQLSVVIDELDQAFAGSGPDLSRLIQSGDALNRAMLDAMPQTVRLINDGKTVLDTQRVVAGDFSSFARDLARLSDNIRGDDPSLRRLIDNGVLSANQIRGLIEENRGALGTLLSNLVTVSGIQAVPVRLDGLRTILTIYPSTVYNGFRAAPGDNKAHFGIVNDNNAPNCATYAKSKNGAGYIGPANRRDGAGFHKSDLGGKAKANADCLLPHGSVSDVRGARNAPRPAGDTTGDPKTWPQWVPTAPSKVHESSTGRPTRTSGSANSGGFATGMATYDPFTDLLTAPDGQVYTVGSDGGQAGYYGADAWKWLLIAPTLG